MPEYDVAIIGGGLGGLLCGTILAKEGKKVVLLEKNSRVGGCLQTFVRDGVLFDTGFHYIGAMGRDESLFPYFRYFGLTDTLQWEKTTPRCPDTLKFADVEERIPLLQGENQLRDFLITRFPDEKSGIENYFRTIQRVSDSFGLRYFHENIAQTEAFRSHETPARQYLRETLKDPLLRGIVSGLAMLYAADGDSSSLYIHSAINSAFLKSSWKCQGGGMEMANRLASQIRNLGGEIHLRQQVKQLVCKNGSVVKAITQTGEEFTASHFIADIHPTTLLPMLDDPKALPASFRSRVTEMEQTTSVFTLYLVIDGNNPVPGLENRYYFDNTDPFSCIRYTADQWPRCFGIFPSSPSAHCPQGMQGFSVMTYMDWEEVTPWEGTFNTVWQVGNRGNSYEAFKYEKACLLLQKVEKEFPEFRGRVNYFYASTPLTWRDYTGTARGAIYGVKRDATNWMAGYLSHKTRIPNMLLTGQNINMHGVIGVSMSALLTCGQIIGTDYLLEKIRKLDA